MSIVCYLYMIIVCKTNIKFYRVTKIKYFIEIRKYKKFPKNSLEYKIYSDFVIYWIKYNNPL